MRTRHSLPALPSDNEPPHRPTEEQFLALGQVIRDAARRHRLSYDDELDFGQNVHLRLLESGYRQFSQFAGRSSLRTFLHVVVERMLLDWRRTIHGKWRPSAAAARLGVHAIELDRLIHRDGCTPNEAIQMIATRHGTPSTEVLSELAAALPARRRMRLVPIEGLHETIGAQYDDPVDRVERRRQAGLLRQALRTALRQLPDEDRRLLSLRFHERQTVAYTAATLRVDAKILHRRYERLLRQLKRTIETGGAAGTFRGNVTPCSAAQ